MVYGYYYFKIYAQIEDDDMDTKNLTSEKHKHLKYWIDQVERLDIIQAQRFN